MSVTDQPLAYSIKEASRVSSLGRTSLFALIKQERLQVIKIGRRTLIRAASLQALLSSGD